ncbi:MAG: bleomycin resistance family protein [Roseivirga sp.]|nr:bleomycin resistance family protein [Roseivirga sp.]
MALTKLVPTFWTEDIKETVDFYVSILGFTCESLELEYGWANLKRDEVSIMLALPTDHVQFNGAQFTGSIYLFSDDVNQDWDNLKDKVKVCYPLETFDYGMTEFAIYDNNGYMIQFGQETTG